MLSAYTTPPKSHPDVKKYETFENKPQFLAALKKALGVTPGYSFTISPKSIGNDTVRVTYYKPGVAAKDRPYVDVDVIAEKILNSSNSN